MLSNFSVLTIHGKIKIYEKRNTFQYGPNTYFNSKSKYFSVTKDSLYHFSLKNLRQELEVNNQSRKYLDNANIKKRISVGVRIASFVPLLISIKQVVKNENSLYFIPMGIGIGMLTVPSFTLGPLINRDIKNAIKVFNE